MREQPWGQYKKKIDRWFWWEATYYDDNQQGVGTVDLFSSADTFGAATADRPDLRHRRRRPRERLLLHVRASDLERRPERLGGAARRARAHHRRPVSSCSQLTG
jgi:hypothetical protein